MNLQYRIDLLVRLGQYILSGDEQWTQAKERASRENGWFIPEFVELATTNIATDFLQRDTLEKWTAPYKFKIGSKNIGIVMAGNIPLVGFHDFLCVFISGHKAVIKPSSKDQILIKHLVEKLEEYDAGIKTLVTFSEMLKGCYSLI